MRKKTSRAMDYELVERFDRKGFDMDANSANVLRLAEKSLSRWYELECGDADGNVVERDEVTGVPYKVYYGGPGKPTRYKTADREKGTLDRVRRLCKEKGWYYYAQGDPRGCCLYIGLEPLDGENYDRAGVACCVD